MSSSQTTRYSILSAVSLGAPANKRPSALQATQALLAPSKAVKTKSRPWGLHHSSMFHRRRSDRFHHMALFAARMAAYTLRERLERYLEEARVGAALVALDLLRPAIGGMITP